MCCLGSRLSRAPDALGEVCSDLPEGRFGPMSESPTAHSDERIQGEKLLARQLRLATTGGEETRNPVRASE